MDTIKEKIVKDLWEGLGTAWSEFDEDEKAQFEKGWTVGYEIFDQLLSEVLQRTGNFSLVSAPPFFLTSGIVITLTATTEAALALLNLTKAPEVQYSPRYLVYINKLVPLNGEDDITYSGIEYGNPNEVNRETNPSINEIYWLQEDGFTLLDGTNPIWYTDPLISGLDVESDQFDPFV